ncbi:hypothetical protein BCAR13_630021 [Paraburkholderia caribensis]|nr:hypothetical protein BCAR13_630021 [Paraburkholderia caribensis]
MSHANRPSCHLGRDHRAGRVHLCDARRLRSRHRPAVSILRGEKRPASDAQYSRPRLGRQRNVSRARRCRPVRCIPRCLFDAAARQLSAVDPDGRGSDLSRRGVRTARESDPYAACVGSRVHLRLGARRALPGHRIGIAVARNQNHRRTFRRRSVRLALALQPVLRNRRAHHVCDARLRMAHPEDGRRAATQYAPVDETARVRAARRHHHREPVDSDWPACRCASLVRQRQPRLVPSRSPSGDRVRVGNLPFSPLAARSDAVHSHACDLLSWLQRLADQHLAKHRAALTVDLGGVVEPIKPAVCAGGHRHHSAHHPCLQRDAISCIPGQSAGGRPGLSLISIVIPGDMDGHIFPAAGRRLSWRRINLYKRRARYDPEAETELVQLVVRLERFRIAIDYSPAFVHGGRQQSGRRHAGTHLWRKDPS